jgi:hypothetical protein
MAEITIPVDSSTIVLNGQRVEDFEAGDNFTLTPVNPKTSRTNSSNNGVTIHQRTDGAVHDLVLRVQKQSDSDVYLNTLRNDPSQIITGSIKEVFFKNGQQGVDTHELTGGSFTTQPTVVKSDTDGNSLMEYTIQFRAAIRSI